MHTGRCIISDEDDEPSLQPREPITAQGWIKLSYYVTKVAKINMNIPGDISECATSVHWEVSRFDDSGASCALICVKGIGNDSILNYPDDIYDHFKDKNAHISHKLKATVALNQLWTRSLSIRLFYIPKRAQSCEYIHQSDLHRLKPYPSFVSFS